MQGPSRNKHPSLHSDVLRFIDCNDGNSRKLGELTVRFDPGTSRAERVINVSFFFGRTEIIATAVDESSKTECHTSFKFSPV